MDGGRLSQLPPAHVSVGGFWEHLAAGEVLQFRRDFERGYEAVVLLGDSFSPGERGLALTRQELLDYEYNEDVGFSLGVSGRLAQALAWIIGAPLMEEETIPNREQLGLARRLVRGAPEAWPPESRAAAERILLNVTERKLPQPEAVTELGAAAPAAGTGITPFCRALVAAVAEGRLGSNEAAALLADPSVPEHIDYYVLREVLLATLSEAEIPLEAAIRLLGELQPTEAEYELYSSTGQVSALHSERELLLKALALLAADSRAAEALRAVIGNEACEDAVTVKIAIWALGRHNDKAGIDYLIPLLAQPQYRLYQMEIEEALSFLCSGAELIPAAEADEVEHWTQARQSLPRDPEAWWRHDAESVFWEKRLRCALELDRHPGAAEIARRLRADEVPRVRTAAGA